ncbi:MAG: YdcF family protein [Lactobacillus sp.]|nr:YdcF family protein [Lactobacillus sp.]MDN6043268.1 YdcF family protein [Lactobacillus sp.]MDN6052065.1 YdcF family protein [Lactobacillus sp.]
MSLNTPIIFCLALLAFTFLGLVGVLLQDRRTLAAGMFATATLFAVGLLTTVLLLQYTDHLHAHRNLMIRLLILLFLAFMFLMLLIFVCVIIMFVWNGIKLIRHEGLRPSNWLALILGLLLFFFPVINLWLVPHVSHRLMYRYLYQFALLCVGWLVFIFLMYFLTALINLVNLRRVRLDYIVVLGAGLIGEQVTPLLAARVRKGIKIYRKYPGSKLILSGGQGPNEVIAEAYAMANYAQARGVPASDLLLETESRTTHENLLFSAKLMRPGASFALVTSSYHVYRALVLAKRLGLECIGYGSKTKWYFTLNAFLREFVAYLTITWKLQCGMILLNGLLIWLEILVTFPH